MVGFPERRFGERRSRCCRSKGKPGRAAVKRDKKRFCLARIREEKIKNKESANLGEHID